MSVNYKDILKTTEYCLTEENESGFRSAISRSYYSVYHCILANLNYFEPLKDKPVHRALTDYLTHPNENECLTKKQFNKIKNDLILLKKSRVKSDYYLNEVVTKEDAKEQIKSAELIIQTPAFLDCDS